MLHVSYAPNYAGIVCQGLKCSQSPFCFMVNKSKVDRSSLIFGRTFFHFIGHSTSIHFCVLCSVRKHVALSFRDDQGNYHSHVLPGY